eukprot:TRINITY_DN12903_c0_g1_i1.p1 TRINITY_DN12903_c0_g1~~TRINITY_DN12903_c0_g1_i1.p1  ORF type:complete len:337 (+),score=134.92 TRINITY_DN12903_c0_g1_i1:54-1013(+)
MAARRPVFACGVRGVFAGAGSDGFSQPGVRDAVLAMIKKEEPKILYVGTATYDLPGPFERQTSLFAQAGCRVSALKLVQEVPTPQEMERQVAGADAIIVSGGNTLFAVDRWHRVGLVPHLEAAARRGCLLCGGSAGAICWFDGGHSDAADPATYKAAMLHRRDTGGDESSSVGAVPSKWDYIRCPCLGFLPGLVCPHYDKVQSNGVPRATDIDGMLQRHPGETAIFIDHWAALLVDGADYSVLSLDGKEGSQLPDGSFSEKREGRPGVWRARVEDGCVVRDLVPQRGKMAELLAEPTAVVQDPRLAEVRAANPDDGPVP